MRHKMTDLGFEPPVSYLNQVLPAPPGVTSDHALPRVRHRPRFPKPKKVAIVHDWLPVYGGAERVLEQIIGVFPQADIFSMVDLLPVGKRDFLGGRPVATSFVQHLPKWLRKRYRSFLPLMPAAVEQFDLAAYDLIISSSYAVAKGVLRGPDQLHVCYCHSPMRYAWDLQHQYLRESNLQSSFKGMIARLLLHYLRLWDVNSEQRVDHFLTNSYFVRRRIQKVYRRDATVIYPPADTTKFTCREKKENYYVTVARMVPYKMIGLLVETFARTPERELHVIGDGPDFKAICKTAPPNVKMLGFLSEDKLREELSGAKAFLYAAEEDFGIVVVEAQACGTPVLAYGKGGALESVIAGKTGLFFFEQTPEAILACIFQFEALPERFQAEVIRKHAESFAIPRFREQFEHEVGRWWDEFKEYAA